MTTTNTFPDWPDDSDKTLANRKIAVKMTQEAAGQGNQIAGMLASLENLAAPFYLGLDGDPDDSDMDVYP